MNASVDTKQSGVKVTLEGVRLSFPDIFKPKQGLVKDDGTPGDLRFGAHGIFEPNGPTASKAKAAAMQAATLKWGANAALVVGALEGSKKCLRNGNLQLAKDNTIRAGYQGMMYVVARSKSQPLILADKFNDGRPVHLHEDGSAWQQDRDTGVWKKLDQLTWLPKVPYGGCYVNMQVEIYAMEGSGAKAKQGKSINATLLAIQFLRDGEAFSGSRADESDFSEVGGPPPGSDPMGQDPFATGTPAAQEAPRDPFAM